MESSSEDEAYVWSKKDRCVGTWSEDAKQYEGVITEFKNSGSRRLALVNFSGYDDAEWIDIRKLKQTDSWKHKKKSKGQTKNTRDDDIIIVEKPGLFSPLRGDEENQRLQQKFQHLEEDAADPDGLSRRLSDPDGLSSRLPDSSKWPTTKKRLLHAPDGSSVTSTPSPRSRPKGVVVQGGDSRPSTPLREKKLDSPRSNSRSVTPRKLSSGSESETETDKSGFSNTDLERPYFPSVVGCTVAPLVLSAPGEEPVVQVPVTINRYLRDYQKDGIRFMYQHYINNSGAILGDDMGLGKTVQVIGLIAAILSKTGTKEDVIRQKPKFIRKMSDTCTQYSEHTVQRPFLIIGPASVLYNWVDELETWGYFTVGKYHRTHKEETVRDLRKKKLEVVVTTFETCRDNIEEINSFEWNAVFADEAHKIKGLKAEVTRALKTLRCVRRYGLTGTPIQNQLGEFWCILDWANAGSLGSAKEFKSRYSCHIEAGQKQEATKRELAEARIAQEKLATVRDKWMLRRTKSIIKHQMPEKRELVVYCRPTELQLDVYRAVLGLDDLVTYVLPQGEPCPCHSGYTRGRCCFKKGPDGRSVMALTFSYMHMLLKTANHVALLLPENSPNENQQRQASNVCEKVFERHPQFVKQTREAAFRTLSDPKYCGKMKVLQGLLKVFRKKKSKVLLFSYSTQLLDILETYVMSMGYEYRRLDGTTRELRRVQLVREFNTDPSLFLFLISTKAGGIGLNLTGANVVVIFDPNWNPTHDLQAQDRAYRIGQRRDVEVYRLVCSGTIEENIYLRQVYKQQLGEVAVSTRNARRYYRDDEIFGRSNLFKLRSSERCFTEDIIKRNEAIESGLKDYVVEKWVPGAVEDKPSDKPSNIPTGLAIPTAGNDEETDEEQEEDEEESSEESGADHDFGANYVCTQMYGLDDEPSSEDEQQVTSWRGKKAAKPSLVKSSHKCLVRPSKRKISTDEESVDNDSDPDDVINHLMGPPQSKTRGAKIAGKGKKVVAFQEEVRTEVIGADATLASISDVLNQSGVVHTHQNRRVIGSSRAEDHMSRCALQDVYELHQYSQLPAANCQLLTASESSSDSEVSPPPVAKKRPAAPKKKKATKATTPSKLPRSVTMGNRTILIGQTPKGIKKAHFQQLMDFQKQKDPAKFARSVILMDAGQRERLLRRFYSHRDEDLDGVFTVESPQKKDTTKVAESKVGRKQQAGHSRGNTSGARVKLTPRQPTPSHRKVRKGARFSDSDTEEEKDGRQEKVVAPTETSTSTSISPKKPPPKRADHKRTKGRVMKEHHATIFRANPTLDVDDSETFFDALIDDIPESERLKLEEHNMSASDSVVDDFLLGEQTQTYTKKDPPSRVVAAMQNPNVTGEIQNTVMCAESERVGGNLKSQGGELFSRPTADESQDSDGDLADIFDLVVDGTKSKPSPVTSHIIKSASPRKRRWGRAGSIADADDAGFYGDKSKWVKNKHSPKFMVSDSADLGTLDSILKDDNEEYENLFKTGKMKKVR